jgi:integrase
MASIYRAGDRWRVQIRRKRRLISHYADSKQAAQKWARAQEHLLDQEVAGKAPTRMTFGELMDVYTEHVGTGGRSKQAALKLVKSFLGKYRLSELSAVVFLEFARRRAEQKAGPPTIRMDLTYVGTVLRHGGVIAGAHRQTSEALLNLQHARITLRHAGAIASSIERDRRPTTHELELLYEGCRNYGFRILPMWNLILFATSTCMRLGEICRIRWEDVDLDSRTVVIRKRKHPTLKESNDQKVPLLKGPITFRGKVVDPIELMLTQPARAGQQRTGRVWPYLSETVSHQFCDLGNRLGIVDLNFHDFRHEGISRLFEVGYAVQQVAVVSGHRNWKQLQRYTNIKPESLHRN